MDNARKYFLNLLKNKNKVQEKEPEKPIDDDQADEPKVDQKSKKKALKAKSKRMNGYNNRSKR